MGRERALEIGGHSGHWIVAPSDPLFLNAFFRCVNLGAERVRATDVLPVSDELTKRQIAVGPTTFPMKEFSIFVETSFPNAWETTWPGTVTS
jgi:hypothetical protein